MLPPPPFRFLFLFLFLLFLPGVSPYAFRNCIQSPRDPRIFRCVQRFLGSVAQAVGDLPAATTSLNLSHNLVADLAPESFALLPRLAALDLGYNLLAAIAPGAFSGLGALATLDLAHNRLTRLAAGSFAGLGNLTSLRLDHNPLASVATEALLPLANLSRLSLRGGRLVALGPVSSALGGSPRLRLLDLCGNRLRALGPGPPLPPSLVALRLCNNSLGTPGGGGWGPPGFFLGGELRVLDLSYNNISHPRFFSSLRLGNLSRLQLAGNPLDPLWLLNVSDLKPRSLDLSGLPLEPGGLGELCRRLATAGPSWPPGRLRLRYNGLLSLPRGSLAACPPVATLDLSGNRLQRLGCLGEVLGPLQRWELRDLVLEHNLLKRIPRFRCGNPRPGSGTPGSGCPPQSGSSCPPQFGSGNPQSGSGNPWFGSRTPRSSYPPGSSSRTPGSGCPPRFGSGTPRSGCPPRSGSSCPPQSSSGTPQFGSGTPGSSYPPRFGSGNSGPGRFGCSPNLPEFPNLRNLSLRFNRILLVGAGAFLEVPVLRFLRLDFNGLARLDREALKGLGELRELRLDNNLLSDLYPGSFRTLGKLRILNLRNNRVAVIFPGAFSGLGRLGTLDLGGNNLRHLAAAGLEGLGALKRLYLDRNRLQEISAGSFGPVQANLGVLDLRANSLRYISRYQKRPPPFRHLGRLYDLKLQAQQPYGLRVVPYRFFQGLRALRFLYLGQNGLLALPEDALDELGQLRFLTLADTGGGLGELPRGVFKNLSNLRVLDLENAGLRSLGEGVVGNLSSLEMLRLAKNELRGFEPDLGRYLPSLRYLDLRKCPLSCSCPQAWLRGWLVRGGFQVVYFYNYTCGGTSRNLLHLFDPRVCYEEAAFGLFCGTAPAVLVLLAVPLAGERCWWGLRYRWYLLRARLRGRVSRGEGRFLYDGFVSYNSSDEGWVLGELVPELEGKGSLRLCLHQRDFSPGVPIVDNIVGGIYSSRRTLCVVSRGYLRSEWCGMELELASLRLFQEFRDVLILVFLEEIPGAELRASPRLRGLLLHRTHLRWPPHPPARPLFWARLRGALRGEEGEEPRNPWNSAQK